ncbi:N-acetylmuramoyl-L-alanine amidase family protein [Paenibacillus daejeonensis]|uniref:N-acetylmuramoyl-L-alanine amidase family protein n=1 Tax=Paenibacillus daejeonensis TaxID=135193 RepID=UPI0003648CBC|nr:N-acetylmuramoyl-L-alanine amidase [Paenibacillus daejeonensis]
MYKSLILFALLSLLLPVPVQASDPPDIGGALPGAEVLIDVGHGGIDGGAHHGSVLEKDINLAIARKLYLMLGSQGIDAVLNRDNDYALSEDNRWHLSHSRHRKDLSQRRQLAKEIPTRLLISLHVNWTPNASKHGPLVLYKEEGRSLLLAQCIQDALNNQQQTTTIPRKGESFYLLRKTDKPAVIVEVGFLSHAGDRAMMTDPQGQAAIARAICNGLRQYLLVTGH